MSLYSSTPGKEKAINLMVQGEQKTPEAKHKPNMNVECTANFSEIGEDEQHMFIMPDLEQGDLSFLNSVNSFVLNSDQE